MQSLPSLQTLITLPHGPAHAHCNARQQSSHCLLCCHALAPLRSWHLISQSRRSLNVASMQLSAGQHHHAAPYSLNLVSVSFSQAGESPFDASAPCADGRSKAGCSRMALNSCVPRRQLVSGRWPLAASVEYVNSDGHFLRGDSQHGEPAR